MTMELTARTPAGAALVALAERLAADLAGRAAEHDRDGSYPHPSIDSLREARYFTAPIPVELGGRGESGRSPARSGPSSTTSSSSRRR
jgi:alkylation response protein AidB-like acyl-CoA dehydrogenase